jgi:opacity protein-like surface antigen
MRMRLNALVTLVAAIVLAAPTLCLATPPRPGPYVSGFIGVAIPSDTDSTAPGINDRIQFDPGVNVGATAGVDLGMLRLEGELSYKHGEMKSITEQNGTFNNNVDGRIGAVAFMGNMFVDLHNPGPITPYFGGGIGFAALHQSDTFAGNSLFYADDNDAVFAYQVGGGLEVALNRMMSLDLGYRYFRTSEATFNQGTTLENRLRFESHNIAAGIRFKFF